MKENAVIKRITHTLRIYFHPNQHLSFNQPVIHLEVLDASSHNFLERGAIPTLYPRIT